MNYLFYNLYRYAFVSIFTTFILVECENDLNCTAEKPYCTDYGKCLGKAYFDQFHVL